MLVGFPVRQFQLCKEVIGKAAVVTEARFKTVLVDKRLPNGQVVKVKQNVEIPVEELPVANLTDDCIWVDEMAIEQYTKRGYNFTGHKRMSYCPPEWIANKEGGGILILDDWNRKIN